MERITSKDNQKFKSLLSLVASKKERANQGVFVAEGLRLVEDAVSSGLVPVSVFATENFASKYPDKFSKICNGCENVYLIADALAQKISDTKTPQGIFAVLTALDKNLNLDKIYNNGHFIFIVSLQDPGNVGTIIRTAEAMGLDGVILLAFILGFPANEIVVPIIVMAYLSQGTVTDSLSLVEMKDLFLQNGWTTLTAVNTILFSLFHWPCSTTLLTVKKETGSIKWTMLTFLIPTIFGILVCIMTKGISMLF